MKRLLLIFAFLIPSSAWATCNGNCVQCTTAVNQQVSSNLSTASFSVLPTVGNYIITFFTVYNTAASGFTLTGMTDNQSGNTYANNVHAVSSDSTENSYINSGKVVGSTGTFTMTSTITGNSGITVIVWQSCEFANIAASTPFDQSGTGTSTATSFTVTATGANAQGCEVVITHFLNGNTYSSGPSGYTLTDATGGTLGHVFAYKTVSAVETSSANVQYSTSGGVSNAVIGTYKASGCSASTRGLIVGAGFF